MIGIIIGISVLFLIFMILFMIYRNKYQFCFIKIDEAEEDIDVYLEKKKELLEKTIPIINKELKKKDFLEEIPYALEKGFNHFELHNFLKNSYNELFKTIDDNEKLLKSETLIKIIDELNDDTVVDYNKLVTSFPSNLVAFVARYKKKDFYSNEKREIFQILNER